MTKYGYAGAAGALSAGAHAAAPGIRLSGLVRPSRVRRHRDDALPGAARRAFVEALAAWRRRRAVQRTIVELSALDDHILYDIGIERSRIPAVARALVEGGQATHRGPLA